MSENMTSCFPGDEWQSKSPGDLGFSAEKLDEARVWLQEMSEGEPFRAVIARGGYIAAEWNQGTEAEEHLRQVSAGKSFYSCLLGIAVAEGKIPGQDARVVDYYPEMMDVEEGSGPKPGRHAFEKDRGSRRKDQVGIRAGHAGKSSGRNSLLKSRPWSISDLAVIR